MRIALLSTFVGLLVSAIGCISLEGGGDSSTSSSSTSSSSTSSTSSTGGGGGTGGEGTGATGGTAGAGGAMSGCRMGSDCSTGFFCASYTLAPLCGGVPDSSFNNDCTADADCNTMGDICDSTLCIVPHGGAQTPPHCRPGCVTDMDCGPGFACSATHHCQAAPCGAIGACGSGNFECMAGQCARKNCTKDSDCANFCVGGQCWANLGECQPAVP